MESLGDGCRVGQEGTSGNGDEELVARARSDPEAFSILYLQYVNPIYRYCFRRLGSREAAEDATSQVFLQALTALPAYRAKCFRSWLFTIARNATIDCYRAEQSDDDRIRAVSPVRCDPSPEVETIAVEERQTLQALLMELPLHQREVIELHLAGLRGPEVARVVGRSHVAVRAIRSRAMARLRQRAAELRRHMDQSY